MKRCLSIILSIIIISSFSISAFAVKDTEMLEAEFSKIMESSNIFGMEADPNNSDSEGISPRITFPGNGGVSTLDYMSSGRYVAWSVMPATTEPYSFVGFLEITEESSGMYKHSEYINDGGLGATSGVVDVMTMGLESGVVYRATLTGQAYDAVGNIFYVNDGVSITFVYR